GPGRQCRPAGDLAVTGPVLFALAGLAAYAGNAAPAPLAAYGPGALLGVRKRLRHPGRVALTFDDGPHPGALPLFLRTLADEDVRATFFLVGEQAAAYPALVRELAAAGHELANHGYRHRNHLLRSPLGIAGDIARGAGTIERISGVRPALYRPCYGVISAATLLGARRAGTAVVLWSRWGRDWRRRATPGSIAREAAARPRGGDIVLLHDADHYASPGSWRNTLAALPDIVGRIREARLEVGAIGGAGALA
ncbi:MAG TPA: polysaccharide deacetylase family protein, partial [Longimicrobiales bacterium]